MPYRRSRLQDYYDQLLGRKPAKPKPKDSTPTHSPFLDFGNPPPPSSPTTSPPPPAPSPPSDSNPVFNKHKAEEHVDGARETRDSVRDRRSARNNPVSPEESPADRMPDIEEAQTEDYSDGAEEASTVTPAEAHVDLLHMAEHLRLLGRAYRDSSPEALHIVRDGLLRPFTYSTIFRHLPTCRESLEFIYADPLDIDDCPVIAFGQRLWQGHDGASGGSSGDTPSDAEQAFTLDDVRQFAEIDTETTDLEKAADYEKMLEAVFGYEIEFDDAEYNYSDAEKVRQLRNLAKANVHIVDYLEFAFVDDDDRSGLSIFNQYFSDSEYGQLKVSLGDNIVTGGAALGLVPLPESDTMNLDMMYLGSAVDIPTIVHEFGHVIDRSLRIEDEYPNKGGQAFAWTDWIRNVGLPLNESILQHAIGGYAGKQFLAEETWADLFMTAVLDPSNPYIEEAYRVYSTTYPAHSEFVDARTDEIGRNRAIAEFYDCAVHGDCERLEVKWAEEEPGDRRDYGALAREHFPSLLRHLLSGQ